MRFSFFLKEALRGAQAQLRAGARGASHRAADRARARRVHPDRPGHDRHGQRGARARGGRRLHRRPATQAEPAELREAIDGTSNVKSVEFISKERGARTRQGEEPEGVREGAELLGSNPLPDVVPHHARGPRQARAIVDRLAPDGASRSLPRSTRSATARRTPRDPLRDRPGQGAHGRTRDPAGPRLDRADREHDPPVDLRPPTRGRGDEAGGRHELVHPLAVRDRGRDRRLLRRRARRAAADDRQGDLHRPALGALRAARRAGHDRLPAARSCCCCWPVSRCPRSAAASRCGAS